MSVVAIIGFVMLAVAGLRPKLMVAIVGLA